MDFSKFTYLKILMNLLFNLQHANQHNRWEDLGHVYINMKNEDVEMDYGVLEVFFKHLKPSALIPLERVLKGLRSS